MVGRLMNMDLARLEDLSQRWNEQVLAWNVPDRIGSEAASCAVRRDASGDTGTGIVGRDAVDVRLARELLPAVDGRVLDVGCGAGRGSVPLVPPAAVVIGVDERIDVLNEFGLAVTVAGARPIAVLGTWPDVVGDTPSADVVVCRDVAYEVADIVPFLIALGERARLGVVMVVDEFHPMTAWRSAWRHFWGIDGPPGPSARELVAILNELGEDPEVFACEHVGATDLDPDRVVDVGMERLCLPSERRAELAEYLAESPVCPVDAGVALRWPGHST